MLEVKDRLSTVPNLKCQFCEKNMKDLGIKSLDTKELEKLLEHYREEHHGDFMSYCHRNEPSRLEPIFLYSEGLKLLESNKEEALEKFLEAQSLLLEDSLFLAVRLGTFREAERNINKLI